MNNFKSWTVILIVILLTPACATYEVRKLSNQEGTPKPGAKSYDKYSISVTESSYTESFGTKQAKNDRIDELKNAYIESTKRVLSNTGRSAVFTENESEANLKIRIEHTLYTSALPQEWLTGLSVGLIPSWGTRPNQYAYTFKDTETKHEQSYSVDITTYNHLFLWPWIASSSEKFCVYEKTLTEYLDGL